MSAKDRLILALLAYRQESKRPLPEPLRKALIWLDKRRDGQ